MRASPAIVEVHVGILEQLTRRIASDVNGLRRAALDAIALEVSALVD
jgi:hypothetical protein